MKKRDEYIDLIKGVGIFLVVLGHHNTILTKYIYSFHMPLFFFLSGIFHSNYSSYKEFIKKKIKGLVIPYFTFAFSLFLFWLFLGRMFGENVTEKIQLKIAFNGIFLGRDIDNISSMIWGSPIWFLLCLFLVANFYYFISKLRIQKIIFWNVILSVCGYYFIKYSSLVFKIWHFDVALIAINFYTLGNLLKKKLFKLENISNFMLILLFLLNLIGYKINGRINMYNAEYSNILLFYMNSILGILFVFVLMKKLKNKSIFLKYIGQNTLIILAYHIRAMTFIKLI